MLARSLALIMLTLATAARAQQPGPQMPNPQEMQVQVQHIMQERPREAEAAARAFLMLVAPNLVSTLDSLKPTPQGPNQPILLIDGVPQNTPDQALGQYWSEVATLTVQFDMVQKLNERDSVRAQLVGKMFGLEANARAQQRAYRVASEARRPAIHDKIEAFIGQHFDLENQLRALEIADIERRLADVRAETTRRKERRAEFIKWAVDDIVRDAMRPR
jgi:hypothetical protein